MTLQLNSSLYAVLLVGFVGCSRERQGRKNGTFSPDMEVTAPWAEFELLTGWPGHPLAHALTPLYNSMSGRLVMGVSGGPWLGHPWLECQMWEQWLHLALSPSAHVQSSLQSGIDMGCNALDVGWLVDAFKASIVKRSARLADEEDNGCGFEPFRIWPIKHGCGDA